MVKFKDMADTLVSRIVIGPPEGSNCTFSLNGPAAWAAPGGSNVATLATLVGDLHLRSAHGGLGVVVRDRVGFVGIGGITAPSQALDVSGSVNVSGTITAGNVGLRYWRATGTTPASGESTFVFPEGVVFANIVNIYGVYATDASTFGLFNSSTGNATVFPSIDGFHIDVNTASSASAKAFTIIIVTASNM